MEFKNKKDTSSTLDFSILRLVILHEIYTSSLSDPANVSCNFGVNGIVKGEPA